MSWGLVKREPEILCLWSRLAASWPWSSCGCRLVEHDIVHVYSIIILHCSRYSVANTVCISAHTCAHRGFMVLATITHYYKGTRNVSSTQHSFVPYFTFSGYLGRTTLLNLMVILAWNKQCSPWQ